MMRYNLPQLNVYAKIGMGFLITALIFIFALGLFNRNKIIIGVEVAGMRLGLKNTSEAETILKSRLKEFEADGIAIIHNELTWQSAPGNVGITFDIQKTIKKAQNIGRSGGVMAGINQQFRGLFGKYNLPLEIEWSENAWNNFYKKNLAKIDEPAQNARLEFLETLNQFNLTPEKQGKIIDKKGVTNNLLNRALFLSTAPVNLEMIMDFPEATISEIEIAEEIIRKISNTMPFILAVKEKEWALSEEDIIDFIEFPAEYPSQIGEYFRSDSLKKYSADNKIPGVNLNVEKVRDYLTVLATGINRKPVNAELRLKNNRVESFSLSQNGIMLNIDASAQKIIDSVKTRNKNIELIYSEIKPEIATDDIDNLGITALLGIGQSNFYGSPESRKHNIQVGSLKFHGILVKPGEEFSFNNILGEIGPQTGYLPALVIQKDKTVPEYGGGLCQVSTTAFRAAINSGLEITERFPHSFPVIYYSPQGFDATIYPPHPDLRFINNTPGHLLIQTKVVGNNLIFEFYGTDDGRKVKIIGPEQYDIKPDGSMKAKLTQKVYDAFDEVLYEKTFYSNYKSPSLYPIERNPLE